MDIFGIVLFWLALGLIPAYIADRKGKSFGKWWVYGWLIFFVALVHAIVMKPDPEWAARKEIEEGRAKKCPHCAEVVKKEAKVCRFCGRDID
jgi:hypothetical protein